MAKEKAKKRIFSAINLALILMAAAFLIGNWSNITNSNNIVSQNFATGMAVSAPSVTGHAVDNSQECKDLVAYWTFDTVAAEQIDAKGNNGSVYAYEPSFGPATGQVLERSFEVGKNGKTLKIGLDPARYFLINKLNGVQITNTTFIWDESSSFTYEFWIKTSSTNGTIFSQTHSVYEKPKIDILLGINESGQSIGGGNVSVIIKDDNGEGISLISQKVAINDSKWHHIALVRNKGYMFKLYVDGKLQDEKNDTLSRISSEYYMTIGFHNKWEDREDKTKSPLANLTRITALIDEFAIWKKALDGNEISDHFDGQKKYCDTSKIATITPAQATTPAGPSTCAAKGGDVFNIANGEKCLGILDKAENNAYQISVPVGTAEMPTVQYACCNKTVAKVYVPYNPATETCPTEKKLGALCEKGAKSEKKGCENLGGKPYFTALQTCSSNDTSDAAIEGLKSGYGCCKVEPVNKTCAELGGNILIDSTKSKCNGGSENVVYPIMGLSGTEICCKSFAEPKTITGTCSELGYTRCNKTSKTKTTSINYLKNVLGYWKFDDGIGNSASDSSNRGNNGTLSDVAWTNGISGRAVSLNEGKSNISITPLEASLSPQVNGKMALEIWVNSTFDGAGSILYKEGEYYLTIDTTSNKVTFSLGPSNQLYAKVEGTSSTALKNSWNHIAVSFDQAAGNLILYVNGKEIGKTTSFPTSTLTSTKNPIKIGPVYAGVVDELILWNVSLSADKIASHFNSKNYAPETYTVTTTQTVKGESCANDAWVGATDDDNTSTNSGMHCCSTGCVQDPIPENCEGGVSMGTQGILNQTCSGKIIVYNKSNESNYFCCLGTVSQRTPSILNCDQQGGEQFDNTAQFCYGGSIIPAKDSLGTVQCCSGVAKFNSERFVFGATEGVALTTQGTGQPAAGGLCIDNSKSYSLGQIANGSYCDTDGKMKKLKEKNELCTKHYECKSNSCYSGQCTDVRTTLSLIPRIWCWLKSWIANPTDVEAREGMVCECLAEFGDTKALESEGC